MPGTLGNAQTIGGVQVEIGANLAGLKAGLAEAKALMQQTAGQLHIGGGGIAGPIGMELVNRGSFINPNQGVITGGSGFGGGIGMASPMAMTTRITAAKTAGAAEGKAYAEGLASGVAQVAGPTAAAGGGLLGGLKESFGRGSAFTQMTRLAMGAGPILGVGLLGRELASASGGLAAMQAGFMVNGRHYDFSPAEKWEKIIENVPIFGDYVKTGRNMRVAMGLDTDEAMDQAMEDARGERASRQLSATRSAAGMVWSTRSAIAGITGGTLAELDARGEINKTHAEEMEKAGAKSQTIKAYLAAQSILTNEERNLWINDQAYASMQWKNTGYLQGVSLQRGIEAAGIGTEIANINGSIGGIWGTKGSRLAVSEKQYERELSEANAAQSEKQNSINQTYSATVHGLDTTYGTGPSTAKTSEADRARQIRDENLAALEKETDAISDEITARHNATDAEIEATTALSEQLMGSSLSTRRDVAIASGKGFGTLAGLAGRIGSMTRELMNPKLTPNKRADTIQTQRIELESFQKALTRPTHYATEVNRGYEAPGGPGGNSGEEMVEVLRLIARYLQNLPQQVA